MDSLSLLVPLFRSAEEHAASAQKPQAALSINAASLSCPQSQTSSASGCSLSSVSRIWARLEFDWGYTYYIRLDHQGSHILVWVGHIRVLRKLTRLLIAILTSVGIQKCKVLQLVLTYHRLVSPVWYASFAVDYIQTGYMFICVDHG